MIHFRAAAYFQGSSRTAGTSPCITIPVTHRALFPGWLRLCVNGSSPFFAFARRDAVVTLSKHSVSGINSGDTLDISIESAEPYRARASTSSRFDWLRFMPRDANYFPTQTGGALAIHYRREPLALSRHPSEALAYWMLGFYQAEGAKRSSNEWSVVSSNPLILRAVCMALTDGFGISVDRLRLDVLHAPGDDPQAARNYFGDVGARIGSTWVRTAHKKWKSSGGRGAVLRVEKSIVFYRMTMAVLDRIFKRRFPTRAAARAFALGWLEGDGGISINRGVTRLGLYGTASEIHVVLHALREGFSWAHKGCAQMRYTRVRSLAMLEASMLARAGAFAYSMNRARLLYALEQRSVSIRRIHMSYGRGRFRQRDASGAFNGPAFRDLLVYRDGYYRAAPAVSRLCAAYAKLQPEMETLRRLSPPERLGKTGVKSAPYPKELLKFNLNRIV